MLEHSTEQPAQTDSEQVKISLVDRLHSTMALAAEMRQLFNQMSMQLDAIQTEFAEKGVALSNATGSEPYSAAHLQQEATISYLQVENPHGRLATQFFTALLEGNRQLASRLIMDAVQDSDDVRRIYMEVFLPVLYEVGRLWQIGRVTVAQEHYVTITIQFIMSQLYERFFNTPRNGRLLIALSVTKNLHEVGIRMIADFFELAGWDSYYLGANMPVDSVVQTVAEQQPDALAISAMLVSQVPAVHALIRALRAQTETAGVRILVGGRPFLHDPGLWQEVGADATAPDPLSAVEIAERLLDEDAG